VKKQRLVKLSFSILHTTDGHENSRQRKLNTLLFSFPFFVGLDKTSKQSKPLFRPISLIYEDNHKHTVISEPVDINNFLAEPITYSDDCKAIANLGKWPH